MRAHAGDLQTCRQLLERRVRQLVETLAARVKSRIDDGMEASTAFLDVQPHAVALARAATESDVFEAFLRVEPDDAQLGVTSNGASQIRSLVTRLSESLSAHSRHLVDSFGIPDPVIRAPIAL
ncbi:MAG TPA: hypothetical protein VHL52_04990 [Acidimicrobiia bacterium]|nr:hypothetical protein [Acidimicrobiia bacterium]